MEYLLKVPSDLEEKKLYRAELKKCHVAFKDSDRILERYKLTEEQLNAIPIAVIPVFRMITVNKVTTNISMLVSQNPLVWNR